MLFRQSFKIKQNMGIWQNLDASFNVFQEDKRFYVHRMCKILRNDYHKSLIYVQEKDIVISVFNQLQFLIIRQDMRIISYKN